jgi:hypothetical protein
MTIKRRVASTMLAAIAYGYKGVTAPGISRRSFEAVTGCQVASTGTGTAAA